MKKHLLFRLGYLAAWVWLAPLPLWILGVAYYPFLRSPAYYRIKLLKALHLYRKTPADLKTMAKRAANPKNWLLFIKKYAFRTGYILFVAYVPSMLMMGWCLHPGAIRPDFGKSLIPYLNPLPYLCEWVKPVLGADLIYWLVTMFILWLAYSWMKRPGIIKAGLLLAISIFLSPVQGPEDRLLLWSMGYEPFFQSLYLPAHY